MSVSSSINDEDLIEAVRARRAIYDQSDKNHRNKTFVAKLWIEIGSELGYDALACKTRWVSMRDYFLRKFRQTSRSGKAIPSKRKWASFDLMTFLLPYITMTPKDTRNLESPPPESVDSGATVENAEDDDVDESETKDINLPCLSTTSVPQHSFGYIGGKRSRTDVDEENDDNMMMAMTEDTPANCVEHFFKSVVPTVANFNEIDRLEFQRDVQDLVIQYARRQQGNYDTLHSKKS